MKTKLILVLTVGGALVLGGCRGERGPASRARQRVAAADRTDWADRLAKRRIELVLSDYGKRLIGMRDRDRRNIVLYPQGAAPEIKWLSHFGLLLERDAKAENGVRILSMNHREVRTAMLDYITEKIYPVSMGLNIMREGRRFLLGDHIESYVRDLELHRSGGGFELIYKKDF